MKTTAKSSDGPCLFCAALQARLDRVAELLALAAWYSGMGDSVAALPEPAWREAMEAAAPGYVCEPGDCDDRV